MRQGRIKAPGQPACAYYHCISRVVDRRIVFHDEEKNYFLQLLREYEVFSGVTTVTFVIMGNHFHLVLKVPQAPSTPLTDEELLARIECLSVTGGSRAVRQQLALFRERNQHEAAEGLRSRYLRRMWDLSSFMKDLKQRFSQWFNKRHERTGTLWESRFKSVLVESAGEALATVAAYVDLNPIRAGLVEDPKDYRWSGYGQAIAGHEGSQAGIEEGMRGIDPGLESGRGLEMYRMWLYGKGEEKALDEHGRPLRKGFSEEEVIQVLLEKGQVPVADYVRLQVRYFTDGVVMGSREYVDGVFGALKERFGAKRQDGARRMRGVESKKLFVLRDLRVNVIGNLAKMGKEKRSRTGVSKEAG